MEQVDPAIDARNLSRSYGERVALADFSLSVPPGSVFGLLGPNGSGKSTFITMLAAMQRPDAGSLTVLGQQPAPTLRRRIGTVFQENALDPLMTVHESLALAARLFGVPGAEVKPRIAQRLAEFGLSERANDPTATLSGGMRRRLEMARALLHDPDLLLLDEPTTGVDPDERRALWDALLGTRPAKRTILLATNDLTEADSVCDHVAFLQAGHVVATGTPDELKRGLRHETLRVTWEGVNEAQLATVATWPGSGSVSAEGESVRISVDDASDFVPRLFAYAPGAIRAVAIDRSSLEDAYFQHVSRRARTAPEVPA